MAWTDLEDGTREARLWVKKTINGTINPDRKDSAVYERSRNQPKTKMSMFSDVTEGFTLEELSEMESNLTGRVSETLSEFDQYIPANKKEDYQRTKQEVRLRLVRESYNGK